MSSINSYTVPGSASDDNGALYEDGVYSDETANFASSSPSSAAANQFSGSISSKMHAAGEQGWRDKWFALAFFAHWVGLIAVAGVYGQKFVTFVSQSLENAERTGDPAAENAAEQKDVKSVIAILCVAAIIGAVGAGFFLWIMKKAQGRVVKVSLALNLLIDGIALIVCFSVGATAVGVIFLVYFVILAIWSFAVRNRIPFAEAVLTATSHVSPGPIFVAFFMSFIMLLWFTFWAFTFTATYVVAYASHVVVNVEDPNKPEWVSEPFTSTEKFAIAFLVFSLYWTSQVFRNISHVTTAGTVASWWLVVDIERPTLGAFKRAMTTSFGTICAGSLVVAIVDTAIWLLNQLQDVGAVVMRCLLTLFNGILKWLNKYAFVETAMYGYSFLDSARAVRTLMQQKFWELIINDSLIRLVFVMGNMLSGTVAGLVGAAWAYSISIPEAGAIGVLCFFIGLALSSLIMIVLDSAVATSYVVWAEDPAAMLRNRPEHYNRIADAAKLMYPNEYQQAVAPRTDVAQPAP